MSEAEDIVAWIEADDDLDALIEGRIYPLRLPASPPVGANGRIAPAVTWQLVSEEQEPNQDGPGLANPRYRFKVWAGTYIELDPIATALKAAFNARHDGPFLSSFVEGSFEEYDIKTSRYWRIVDVLGWQPASTEPAS